MYKLCFLGRKPIFNIINSKYYIENNRFGELQAINSMDRLNIVRSIENSDFLFFRNKPENTTDLDFNKLKNIEKKYKKKVINPISSFYNYDLKDKCFSLWKKNGLLTPEYIRLDYKNSINDECQKIKNFIKKNDSILLRTNNETGSKGMYYLDNYNTDQDITIAFNKIKSRLLSRLIKHKNSCIIAVDFIGSNNNYNSLNRVHVFDGKVLGGYALVSYKNIFHAKHMNINDFDKFIFMNKKLSELLLDNDKVNQIIKSINVLGNNIGAVEFFCVDDKIIFLELNPMWGGNQLCFGAMQKKIIEKKNELYKEVPMVYNWLDKKKYYKKMYELLL